MEAAVRPNRSRVLITLPSGIVALAKFGAATGWIVRDSDVRYSDDSATAQSLLEWSRKIFRQFAQLLSHRDVKLFGRELMAVERPSRTPSRTSKSRRKPQKSSERSTALWPEPMDDDDQAEKTDRLLLSSLRYWEVERDLIEECRSAPNPIRLC